MRKRILIASIAIVVIGVGMYLVSVLSGPKKGSLEWHKERYVHALDALAWRTPAGRCEILLMRLTGERIELQNYEKLQKELKIDREVLIESGFLTERRFENISAGTVLDVMRTTRQASKAKSWQFADVRTGLGGMTITAARADMPRWEELIRKIEAESGK